MERIICVLIGYAFGLFPTGYLYGKYKNVDIREHGSGNLGSTNALRTLGFKAGAITFIGDSCKCILAVVVAKCLFAASMPDALALLGLYAGMGAVLGHNYPFYFGFKGGKGVAASTGLLLVTNFWIGLLAVIAFFAVVRITKYVSVGSIVLLSVFAIGIITYGQMGGFGLVASLQYEMDAIAVFLLALTIYRHKANIVRLMNGTENKVGSKKK